MTIKKYVINFLCTTEEGGFFTGYSSKEDEANDLLKDKETVVKFKKFAEKFCKMRNLELISVSDSEFTYK